MGPEMLVETGMPALLEEIYVQIAETAPCIHKNTSGYSNSTIGKRPAHWQGKKLFDARKAKKKRGRRRAFSHRPEGSILVVVFVHAFFDAVQRGDDDGREVRENSDDSDKALHRAVHHVPEKLSQHDILLVTCPGKSYVELFTTIF
jgi:hypothetical protein